MGHGNLSSTPPDEALLDGLPQRVVTALLRLKERFDPPSMGAWIDLLPAPTRRSVAVTTWRRALADPAPAPAVFVPPHADLPQHDRGGALDAWAARHHLGWAMDAPLGELIASSAVHDWQLHAHLPLPLRTVLKNHLLHQARGRRAQLPFTPLKLLDALAEQQFEGALVYPPTRVAFGALSPVRPGLRRFLDGLRTTADALAKHAPPSTTANTRVRVVERDASTTIDVSWQVAHGYGFDQRTVQLSPAGTLLTTVHPFFGLKAVLVVMRELTAPDGDLLARLDDAIGAPPWERALRRIVETTRTAPDADDDKNTLLWRVHEDPHGLVVQPVRARRKRTGDGWVTRRVTVPDVPLALLQDPVDRHVADLMRPWQRPPREVAHQALMALVAHPRVTDADGEPLRVRRRRPTLRLAAADPLLTLTLEVDGEPLDAGELAAGIARHAGGVLPLLRAGELSLIEIDGPSLAFFASWAAVAQDVTLEALPAVLQRLPEWSAHLPISLDPSLAGRPVDGDLRPLLLLDGGLDALRVTVRVRPLPDAAPQVPGAGAATVFGHRGGRTVHVVRDLDDEAAAVRAAVDGLPLPDSARIDAWSWTLDRRDDTLDLVRAVRGAQEDWQIAWFGEPPVVRRAASARDLTLRVGSGRDWFHLEGGLTIDGVQVDVRALLDAVREHARFVRLTDGSWAALERDLSRALTTAASVGDQLSTVHAGVLSELAEAGVQVDLPARFAEVAERIEAARDLQAPLPDGLEATLRPYQIEGFTWLASLAHWAPGACLADDMGLGKTVQALALLLRRAPDGPALVVAPTSLLFTWEREAQRFAPSLRLRRHHGSARSLAPEMLGPGDVVITTYGVVASDVDALSAPTWATLVLDEAHAVKNPGTARAKAIRRLRADFRLALTGTPVENHAGELWSLYDAIVPGLLGTAERFRSRFLLPIAHRGDKEARATLARLVRPFLLRRTKAAVAPELPPRVELVHDVVLSAAERGLYDAARLQALASLEETDAARARFKVFAALQTLRQLACHPRLVDPGSPVPSSKLAHAVRLLRDLHEEGHRALVFSQFTRHLDLVEEALAAARLRWVRLDGSTPEARRREVVDAFQAGEADVFLISLKAGGVGLNLTAASYVLHLDPWWNPAAEDQATDRAHRIGQDQTVTVVRLVARGTIEDQILALHATKRELADALVEGTDAASRVDLEALRALLLDPGDPAEDDDPLDAVDAP